MTHNDLTSLGTCAIDYVAHTSRRAWGERGRGSEGGMEGEEESEKQRSREARNEMSINQ